MPSIDEIYVEIKLTQEQFKQQLAKMQQESEGKASQIQKNLNFKAKFDNSLARLSFKQLEDYHKKLQSVYNKKLSANVDNTSLERTKQQLQSVNKQMEQIGTSTKSIGAKITEALVALGAVTAFFSTIKKSISLSIEQAKAEAGVAEAVRRTGEAAGFTALQLNALAGELQKLTGIDDDQILSGVTKQLLVFQNISGDVFKRAQQAVLDLNSVIANGEISSLASQSIQLGKALDNPIRGITTLQRAGITFTETQKKMIVQFVETNDILSAQEIILSQIESKYGGQAKAMAEADKGLKKMHASLGDVFEELGNAIVETTAFSWVLENFTGGLMTITKWLQGAKYEQNLFNKSLDDLKGSSAKATLDSLRGSTQAYRDELRKWNSEQLLQNNAMIGLLKIQIKNEAESLRFSDSKLTSLQDQLKTLQMIVKVQEGEISGLDSYEEKINRAKQQWQSSGKTIADIKERIDDLSALLDSLEPKDPLTKKTIAEINSLTKLLPKIGEETGKVATLFTQISNSINEPKRKLEEIEKLLTTIADTPENIELRATLVFEKEKLEKDIEKRQIEIGIKPEQIEFEDIFEFDKLRDEFSKELDAIIAEESKSNLLQQQAIDEYYSNRKTKDEEYVAWKLKKIAEESEIIAEQTKDRSKAESYALEQRKELEQEYFDWKVEQWREQNKVASAAFDAMTEGLNEAFRTMRLQTSESASVLEKIFVNLANAFIAQVQRMIAEWLTFQLLEGIVSVAAAPFTGGASLAVAAMKQGGEFYRGNVKPYSQIPKFASGAEFNVPSKYINDSFLMRVNADERVKVTPANRVGDTDKLLSNINSNLSVLNANLINKDFAPNIYNDLRLNGKTIAKEVASEIKTMQREGRKF